MGMFDEVKCGFRFDGGDADSFQTKSIEGCYVGDKGQTARKRGPDLDLFFIQPTGRMFIIPNALYSTDCSGIDRSLLKFLLDGKYPETLAGLAILPFWPSTHFVMYPSEKYFFVYTEKGRVQCIISMPVQPGDSCFQAWKEWRGKGF